MKKRLLAVFVLTCMMLTLLPVFAATPAYACHPSIEKTGPECACVGETITYNFRVKNHGHKVLEDVTVTDSLLGFTEDLGDMQGNAVVTFSKQYTVPESSPDVLRNRATVTGYYDDGEASASDNHNVNIKRAAIDIVKSGPESACEGDEIQYSFTVTNTGNVTLHNVTVSDPLLGINNNIGSLRPGESRSGSKPYTVPADCADPLVNTASVTGSSECGCTASDEASHRVNILQPDIDIEKTGPESACVGQRIKYTITVTNTGETNLCDVHVADAMLGLNETIRCLAPGESRTYNKWYRIKPGDPENLVNTATATACSQCGGVSDEASHTVFIGRPGIKIWKNGPGEACVGETIQYNFKVKNTGNIPLRNVRVTDPLLGLNKNLGTLQPDEVREFSEPFTVPAIPGNWLDNTATARGCSPCGEPSDSDCHRVRVKKASIVLTKSGPLTACSGSTIKYRFKVRNTGNVPLTNVVVTDPMLGGMIKTYAVIPAGAIRHFNVNYNIPEDYMGLLTNTANVVGQSPCGPVGDDDCHVVCVKNPSIQITKSGPEHACKGEEITYNFTVTNTGNTVLWFVTVKDPLFGDSWHKFYAVLGPGCSKNFSVTYTVPEDIDVDPLTNTATVKGFACIPCCKWVRDDASWEVDIYNPKIKIKKTGPDCAKRGDEIEYKIKVKNKGDTDLTNIVVTDPLFGDTWQYDVPDLGPGEKHIFFVPYTIQEDDPNPLENTATVVADAPCGQLTKTSSWEVPIAEIALTKEGPECARRGDEVTYEITVENIGEVDLTNIEVTDDVLGDVGDLANLIAGGDHTFEVIRTIEDEDPNPLTNTATVTADAPCGQVTATDDHTVNIAEIALTKEGPNCARVGDEVTYEITIENTGQVHLTNAVVTDDVLGDVGDLADLGIGDSHTFEVTRTVEEGDPNPLMNTATVIAEVSCEEPNGNNNNEVKTVTASDDHTVHIPEITLTKEGPDEATVGDEVTYTFTIENTGQVDLTNVNLTDDVLGDVGHLDDLAIGETQQFEATHTVEEDPRPLINTAIVTGDAPCGEVSDEATHTMEVNIGLKVGAVGITKVLNDPDGNVEVGDTFSYTITIENTGESVLETVKLTDTYNNEYLNYQFATPASDDNIDDGEIVWSDVTGGEGLEPGESVVVTAYFVAAKAGTAPETDNDVNVFAVDQFEKELTADDMAVVGISEKPAAPEPEPEPVQPAAPEPEVTAQLPYTGDSLHILFTMALALMILGPGLMLTHFINRRRSGKVEK